MCPALQGEAARVRYPIEASAFGMMIEQLFGRPAAVVVAGAEEKNRLYRSPSVSCDLLDRSTIPIFFFEPPYLWADGVLDFQPVCRLACAI
jgi:hypothetical protein